MEGKKQMIRAAKRAVSRRLFMRAVPAVPLIAPKLASDFVNAPMGLPIGYASGIAPQAAGSIDLSYMVSERSRLERIISGYADERQELHERHDYRQVAYHYDGLRSVSPAARAFLFRRETNKRDRAHRIDWAKIELKDLLARFVK